MSGLHGPVAPKGARSRFIPAAERAPAPSAAQGLAVNRARS